MFFSQVAVFSFGGAYAVLAPMSHSRRSTTGACFQIANASETSPARHLPDHPLPQKIAQQRRPGLAARCGACECLGVSAGHPGSSASGSRERLSLPATSPLPCSAAAIGSFAGHSAETRGAPVLHAGSRKAANAVAPMGRAFGPTMHYVYADRWTAALTPRAFNGPLLDNLQWDDTTWSQCLIRQLRREARPTTPTTLSGPATGRAGAAFVAKTRQALDPILWIQLMPGPDRVVVQIQDLQATA